MSNVTKADVLSAVQSLGGASATKISKEVGYSKKSAVVSDFLEELVNSGSIESNVVRGVVTYTVADIPSSDGFVDGKIPTVNYGWTIQEQARGFKITTPEGVVKTIKKNERVLVINNDPNYRFKISNPEELLAVASSYCYQYSQSHNMYTFSVKDVYTQEYVGGQVSPSVVPVVIFLEVQAENKAGN